MERNADAEIDIHYGNYLEAIYELSEGRGSARLTDIAERLGVTKASANSAISTLSGKDLVLYEPYKEISLTPTGFEFAKNTSGKHQVIKRFLSEVLDVKPMVADTDACAIEHVISCDSINAMQRFMQVDEMSCLE